MAAIGSTHISAKGRRWRSCTSSDASVLMLGVGFKYCTALHLAEYRYTGSPPTQTYACVVARNGKRGWTGYQDVVLDDRDFEEIGKFLPDEVVVRRGLCG